MIRESEVEYNVGMKWGFVVDVDVDVVGKEGGRRDTDTCNERKL